MIYFFLAPGNVAENVVLERESESTITFVEGAREAYLGYMTLKVSWYCMIKLYYTVLVTSILYTLEF